MIPKPLHFGGGEERKVEKRKLVEQIVQEEQPCKKDDVNADCDKQTSSGVAANDTIRFTCVFC